METLSLGLSVFYGGSKSYNAHRNIDLQSDAATKPSQEMLAAMFNAKVGDDVYKEDPTVNKLEEVCAELFGMEKALFVPTGTMGNLLAIMSHVEGRGEEIIIGANQHVNIYEQGHFSQLASIPARVLPNKADGTIAIDDIKRNIFDASNIHKCKTKLICLENTHMLAGGSPLPVKYVREVSELAHSNDIKLHIDGARIYNAAVYHGVTVKELLRGVDSVVLSLSKGLGCPVGSVLGGTAEMINKAKRNRKALGGGMRQAGFIAAAGLHALKFADETLRKDHENADILAKGIHSIESDLFLVSLNKVKTNIVFVKTPENMAREIVVKLREKNILCCSFNDSTIRLVLHLDITTEDVEKTIHAFQRVNEDFKRKDGY